MIYKISWALALIFGGLLIMNAGVPLLPLLTGVSLIVAGIASLANI